MWLRSRLVRLQAVNENLPDKFAHLSYFIGGTFLSDLLSYECRVLCILQNLSSVFKNWRKDQVNDGLDQYLSPCLGCVQKLL